MKFKLYNKEVEANWPASSTKDDHKNFPHLQIQNGGTVSSLKRKAETRPTALLLHKSPRSLSERTKTIWPSRRVVSNDDDEDDEMGCDVNKPRGNPQPNLQQQHQQASRSTQRAKPASTVLALAQRTTRTTHHQRVQAAKKPTRNLSSIFEHDKSEEDGEESPRVSKKRKVDPKSMGPQKKSSSMKSYCCGIR